MTKEPKSNGSNIQKPKFPDQTRGQNPHTPPQKPTPPPPPQTSKPKK
jgi:hypothetical protein